MQCALQLEKNVNQALLDLHKLASEHVDPHVSPVKRPLRFQNVAQIVFSQTDISSLSLLSCVTSWRPTIWMSR